MTISQVDMRETLPQMATRVHTLKPFRDLVAALCKTNCALLDLPLRPVKWSIEEGPYPAALIRENITESVAHPVGRADILETFARKFSTWFNSIYFLNSRDTGEFSGTFPVGLVPRLYNPEMYGVGSECVIDGAHIDLSPANFTYTALERFLLLTDCMLHRMNAPSGDGVVLYCGDVVYRALMFVVRFAPSDLQIAVNRKLRLRNALIRPIRELGDSRDIYAVRYGDSHVRGWLDGEFAFNQLPQENGTPYLHSLLDFMMGVEYPRTGRDIGIIRGINTSPDHA